MIGEPPDFCSCVIVSVTSREAAVTRRTEGYHHQHQVKSRANGSRLACMLIVGYDDFVMCASGPLIRIPSSRVAMEMSRYIAFLNDVIDLDFGVTRLPNGCVMVTDCYRNTHTLTPEILLLLNPTLRMAIEKHGSSNQTASAQ